MRFQAFNFYLSRSLFAGALLLSLAACKGPWAKEFKQEKKAPNVDVPMFAPIPTLNLSANGGPKTINVTLTDADSYLPCNEAISTVSSNTAVVPATYMAVTGVAPNCKVTVTPAPGVVGSSTITLTVTDGKNVSSQSFVVNSYGVPSASVTPVPLGIINVAHTSFTVSGSGGLPPYTYSLASGSLPAGMMINSSTGVVSGTPTDYGKFSSIVFRAADSGGGSATTAAFDLYIASYNLNFTTSAILPTGVSLARGSAGARISSAGLVEFVSPQTARFSFESDGSGVSRGILVEEGRANLLRLSERFDAPYSWTQSLATISTPYGVAPDGATTAQPIKETTVNGVHGASVAVAKAGVALPYTFSVFLKALNRTSVNIRIGSAGGNYAQATCALSGAGNTTPASTAVGSYAVIGAFTRAFPNGWYRCSISAMSDTATSIIPEIRISDGSSDSYAGNTANGIYAWGAQLENARAMGSYIPARNLLTLSEQVDTSGGWATSNATSTSNLAVAPDGTTTADELKDTVTNQLGSLTRSYAIATSADDYTLSVYVRKRASAGAVVGIIADTVTTFLGFPTAYETGIAFDAFTGNYKPTNTNGDPASSVKVEAVGANYWRVGFTVKSRATNQGALRISLYPAYAAALGTNTSTTSANAAVDTAYFWGLQLEPGYALSAAASPTYFRMTTVSEREPDLLDFSLSNGPFNASEGTAISSVSFDAAPVSAPALCFSDGTISNKITHNYTSSLASLDLITNGVAQTSPTRAVSTAYAKVKMAAGYKYNDLGLAVNGTMGGTGSVANIPVTNRLRFGRNEDGSSFLNGHVRSFLYYNARVPNAYLPTLSLTP